MAITIENATITATFNKVRYVHDFTTTITINDPRTNALSTSPQGVGKGIAFRTNTASPVATSFVVRDLPIDLLSMYKKAHKDQLRIDIMIADTATGERYDLNESIITTSPTNATIAEGESSLDVTIAIETPTSTFNHVDVNA